MPTSIALLRGVNLGKRQVVMSELRAACEAAGFENVRTLVASGNLVLDAKLTGAKLEAELERVILEALGLKTDVFVRSPKELDAMIAANPFKAFTKASPTFMVAHFLKQPLSAADKAVFAAHEGQEEMKPGKNCLYITYPDGQGRSKLKPLKHGTARNWNTLTKLAAMAAE